MEVTFALARQMLDLVGIDADPQQAIASGRALDTFAAMIKAQGGDPDAPLPEAAYRQGALAAPGDGWVTGGSSRAEVTGSHWDDYTVTAADGTATLAATVPHPYGDAFLGQEFLAGDYHGTTVTLRAEIRAQDVADHGELNLYIVGKPDDPPAPGPFPQAVHRERRAHRHTITGNQDWTSYELTAPVPARAEQVEFDLTLTGPGQIGLRNVTFTRTM